MSNRSRRFAFPGFDATPIRGSCIPSRTMRRGGIAMVALPLVVAVLSASGCSVPANETSAAQTISTFLTDFARQVVAAWLL